MSVESSALTAMQDLENWYRPLPDGGYRLTDPLNGQHLSFGYVPSWVTQEPTYQPGIEFLQRVRMLTPPRANTFDLVHDLDDEAKVQVLAIYSRHQFAEDLGPIEKGWFERRVAESDCFGLEYRGHTGQDIEDFVDIAYSALNDTPSPNFKAYLVNHERAMVERYGQVHPYQSFLARIGRAVSISGTPVFSHDVRLNSPAAVEKEYLSAMNKLIMSKPSPEEGVVFAALMNACEWIQAANIATQMHDQLEGEVPLEPFQGMLIADGDLHRDLSRKLRLLGAGVIPVFMGRFMPEPPLNTIRMYARGELTEHEAEISRLILFGIRYAVLGRAEFQKRILDELREELGGEDLGVDIPQQRTDTQIGSSGSTPSNQKTAGFRGKLAAAKNIFR